MSTLQETTVNILLNLPISGLPRLNIPLPSNASISLLHQTIVDRLPELISNRFYLSTTSGCILSPVDFTSTLSTLTPNDLLPLRLSATLPGGKGGFGSQLRAAGGRMSSRKKRGQEENNDSCRNLDGRRIRTVKEAKALAAYLEIKPEMDRKEKDKRKERWRKIVEMAEKREAIDSGKDLGGFRFDDTKWLEQTEEEKEKTREAVLKAMKEGLFANGKAVKEGTLDNSSGTSSGGEGEEDEDMKEEDIPSSSSGAVRNAMAITAVQHDQKISLVVKSGLKFHGFDEDDDFMSSDDAGEEEDMQDGEDKNEEVKGKGKAKA